MLPKIREPYIVNHNIMTTQDFVNIYEEAKKENLSSSDFAKKINELFYKNDSISCSNNCDYIVPKNKETEFCQIISMFAWEDRCRGYGFLTSEKILETIIKLKSK